MESKRLHYHFEYIDENIGISKEIYNDFYYHLNLIHIP